MFKQEDEIRVPVYGSGEIKIDGLSKKSFEKLMASLTSGAYYTRVKEGKLEAIPIWNELPSPIEDETMYPFWRKATQEEQTNKNKTPSEILFSKDTFVSSSIYIHSLCGYNYTEEGYKLAAEKLESYGFVCMRSKRSSDGKFWEAWFLPGLFSAEGELAEVLISSTDEKIKLKIALNFISKNISFGSLEVVIQRIAMILED